MEFFSGMGEVQRAFNQNGCKARGFDIINHPGYSDVESITTDEGFCTALQYIRRLKTAKGLAHWATVCSTWVWMSRGSTGRSQSILGNVNSEPVAEGNMQVSRMVLLIMLIVAKSARWILEQPLSSLMPDHPDMAALRPWIQVASRKIPNA